jgi:predicted short-subunit dehydrogenase-like oxidoreductase (DUF2520 family)
MKIVIIGSGNVATVLGRKLLEAEHTILQVMSRQEEHAAILADALNCGYTSTWNTVSTEADIYLIAISDNSLMELPGNLVAGNKLVVHTAGSVSKEVLKDISKNHGVVYPLQSLRKEIKEAPEIPLLVDGNTEDGLALIYDFAKTISGNVQVADDAHRLKLHVAAVMVSNFTNHLYALAEYYCKMEQLDFRLLLPLIEETAHRIRYFSPNEVQTGPASRNDRATISVHLQQLDDYPALKHIYESLTKSIEQMTQ